MFFEKGPMEKLPAALSKTPEQLPGFLEGLSAPGVV
jgi:hypothetical protein